MVKKVITRVLSIVLATSMLVGCSSSTNGGANGDNGEKTKLLMSVWGSDTTLRMYEKRIEGFEARNEDIDVELLHIPSAGDYDQKIQTMLAGNTAPDVMVFAEQVHNFSSKNQLVNLNEYVEKEGIDLDATFGDRYKLYTRDGNLYGMPDRGGNMVLFYNKDLFDAAGVEYPTGDWSWDDLLNAVQKLTIKEGDEVKQWGIALGDWWAWWLMFIHQNGGRLVDENGNVTANSPEVIEALQFFGDLVTKYDASPKPSDYQNLGLASDASDPLFAQQKAAMQMSGFWSIAPLHSVEDFNWDIATPFGGKENVITPFGSALTIAEQSKNKDSAWKLVNYLTSEEGQMEIVHCQEDVPANLEAMNSDEFMSVDINGNKINMNMFDEASSRIINVTYEPWFAEVKKEFTSQVGQLLLGNIDAKQCAEKLQKEVERIVKEYK